MNICCRVNNITAMSFWAWVYVLKLRENTSWKLANHTRNPESHDIFDVPWKLKGNPWNTFRGKHSRTNMCNLIQCLWSPWTYKRLVYLILFCRVLLTFLGVSHNQSKHHVGPTTWFRCVVTLTHDRSPQWHHDPRSIWGIMAKFSGAFLCDCMGESCQKTCTTLGGPGQLLAAFLGDCFGEVLQESRKLLGGPWQAPWEILGRFFFFKILERPWPKVVGILGRLPWKGLWQVLQNTLGNQGRNPRGILVRLPWGILQSVMQIAWETLASSLRDSWQVCKIL